MNGRRFDRMTAALAAGHDPRRAPSRSAADSAAICLFDFAASVRRGPEAGTTLAGVLALGAGPSGEIDAGGFVPLADGKPGDRLAVVGQTVGRAISLLFRLPSGNALYGVGTLEYALAECTGAAGGPFVGPLPGDGGDWEGKQPLVIVRPEKETCSTLTCGNCRGCANAAYGFPGESSDQVTAACRASLPLGGV
jgi:hypothetical protein